MIICKLFLFLTICVSLFTLNACNNELPNYSQEYAKSYDYGYYVGFQEGAEEGYARGYSEARNGLPSSMDWFYTKYPQYR